MAKKILPIVFNRDEFKLLDQRLLPHQEIYYNVESIEKAHEYIKSMVVRGAPCIGFTGVFAFYTWVKTNKGASVEKAREVISFLNSARPTAVNLQYELSRCYEIFENLKGDCEQLLDQLYAFAEGLFLKLESDNTAMANHLIDYIQKNFKIEKLKVLTHCNTGFLACGSIGTALGFIEIAHQKGLIERVYVDETRPYLQGSRLTSYELTKLEIPHQVVVDSAISYLMANKMVDLVVVGADRIACNGDTANKIGTSTASIVSNYYNVPFFVLAPTSSFDTSTVNGLDIEIELRPKEEILKVADYHIAKSGTDACNPSFDVTEGKMITGIINENKIYLPPYNFKEQL